MSTKYFTLIILVAWSFFITGILINSISSTPFQFPIKIKALVVSCFPEGWGFFTRNPRETSFEYYFLSGNEYLKGIEPCTNSRYLYGISRECRVLEAEVQHLAQQVEDSIWNKGKTEIQMGFEPNTIETDSIVNAFRNPTILGNVILLKKQRIPWAWSKNRKEITPQYEFVKVFVSGN